MSGKPEAAISKPPLTELAKKYTHPVGESHKIIAHTGKSGLTPIQPPLPGFSATRNQKLYIRELRQYQAWRGGGFTTQNLIDLEAFAASDSRYDGVEFDLRQIPIHPLIAISQWDKHSWRHFGKVPIGGGKPGYWEVQNSIVRRALEPCLKLATLFLQNAHTFVWWEAFLNGTYTVITENVPASWDGGDLLRFGRPIKIQNVSPHEIQRQLTQWVRKLEFKLGSGWTISNTGLPQYNDGAPQFVHATTFPLVQDRDRMEIVLAYESLMPLLRNDITTAERKEQTFFVASIILHELPVTCNMAPEKDQHPATRAEPYYENESLQELGYSMEHGIFGGFAMALTEMDTPGKGLPTGAIFRQSFFNKGKMAYEWGVKAPAIPPFPADWNYQVLFPIPSSYFEDIQVIDFWEYLRIYGAESTHLGPRTEGSTREIGTGMTDVAEEFDPLPESFIPIVGTMTATERFAAELENTRRQRAIRIWNNYDAGRNEILNANAADDAMYANGSNNANPNFQPFIDLTPGYQLFTNEDPEIGKTFNCLEDLVPEDDIEFVPFCPRYDEIKAYVLANRARGRLCFDTMEQAISEPALHKYIGDYGGINLTPEELNAFLMNCNTNGELFTHSKVGNGIAEWCTPILPPAKEPLNLNIPVPPRNQILDFITLSYEALPWYELGQDYDFYFLLAILTSRDKNPQPWLDENSLRRLIDWHDAGQGNVNYWTWGPNGLVRRRVSEFDDPDAPGEPADNTEI